MYIRPSHQSQSAADTLAIVRQYHFATLVTAAPDLIASHLPFMIDPARGEHGTLLAHMARANPQSAVIGRDVEALVIFHGPHAYISPSWYHDRATAPTWDYIAVHCYGVPRRHSDDEALQNITRLVGMMEAESARPWSVGELSDDSVAAMIRNVVSFEIPVARIESKFKLNQGEKPERNALAIEQLERAGEDVLAAYMRRYNGM